MSHFIQDSYLSRSLVEAARATWPAPDWEYWHEYANGKLATGVRPKLPEACRIILEKLAELPAIRLLYPRETAPPQIFPDLEYLHGAGLHQMIPGKSLGLHLDSEKHPRRPWKREISCILYLDECKGGALDLTDASGNIQKRIEPYQNRMACFTTPDQWHRVNEVQTLRRSICLFFWSVCDESFVGETQAKFV